MSPWIFVLAGALVGVAAHYLLVLAFPKIFFWIDIPVCSAVALAVAAALFSRAEDRLYRADRDEIRARMIGGDSDPEAWRRLMSGK